MRKKVYDFKQKLCCYERNGGSSVNFIQSWIWSLHCILPCTVNVTSHCASPVSQVYVPASSGTRLWMQSWWNAPFFFRSYLRPARMATLFLIQLTVAFGSEMQQARVTISPSTATVSCGFSKISTANMRKMWFICSLFHILYYLSDQLYKSTRMCTDCYILSHVLHKYVNLMFRKKYAFVELNIGTCPALRHSVRAVHLSE